MQRVVGDQLTPETAELREAEALLE